MTSITVILGAGFSQALGIPGTATMSERVDAALDARYREVYRHPRERLKTRFGAAYNFEVLAAALEACEPFGKPNIIAAPYSSVVPEVAVLRDGLTVDSARGMYETLMMEVTNAVSIDWRSALPDPERQRIQLVFDRLARQYDRVAIATLNYDLGAEAFQSHYTDGFSGEGAYQYFSPAKFLKHDTGVRIAHLHGSIAYGILEAPPTFVKINGGLVPRRVPLWMPLKDGSLYTGVITGHDKPNKLVMQPYSVYFAWLAGRLLHSNRLLVIGYGVGDVHLNVWLMTAVRHHAMEDLRCVIIDRFDPLSEQTPPVMNLYAYATGGETPLTAKQRRAMAFDRGIARDGSVMIVHTGFPLQEAQVEEVIGFLTP